MADIEKLNVGNAYTIADAVTREATSEIQTEVEGIRTGADGITYSSAGEAVREQFSDIKAIIDEAGLFNDYLLNLNSYNEINYGIATNNKWLAGSDRQSFFIPVTDLGSGEVTITANAENGSVIAFLKNNSHVSGSTPAYCDGTVRTFIQAGESRTFGIPDDCAFLYVLSFWTYDYKPQSITGQESTLERFASKLEDRIGLTVNEWTSSSCIRATAYGPDGNLQGTQIPGGAVLKASGFVPVSGKMLELPMLSPTGTTFPNYGISLYDANREPILGRAIGAPLRVGDARYVWLHIYLPEEAAYFRTTYWADDTSTILDGYAPRFTYNLLAKIPEKYKPITHELPVDTFMQNAIRRARQLTDIKWTPRVNIPRYSLLNGSSVHFLDWFYADHEYIGVPYSGAGKRENSSTGWTTPEEWGYAHQWVGGCIPFESFITAARYPNSILGEKVGQSQPDYDSSPYGVVCTALVNYAVDGAWPLRAIRGFFDTSDNAYRKPADSATVAEINANDITIGDFLYTTKHVIIITDLLRDGEGNVTHVEMAEATTSGNANNSVLGTVYGGVSRRKMWRYQEFLERCAEYVKYRRVTFAGLSYTPSDYVDTGNEGDRKKLVDFPCIPYLGEGAIYKVGYIHNSKICIGATGFTTLIVTKDGEEFGSYDVTGLTEVSVGFADTGSYEAYLSDGTTDTVHCHWTVE